MLNNKIKLFDELVINEYDLSKIISNYTFPKKYYEDQLKAKSLEIPKNDKDFKEAIIKNKDKIKFRTKNIIFVGYDNKITNKYYFFQLTTKYHPKLNQSLYFHHYKGHKVYINTNKIFYFNFDKQKFWYSKFNKNKKTIIQKNNWKSDFLNNIPIKIIKTLCKVTNIEIYKIKLKEYKYFKNILGSMQLFRDLHNKIIPRFDVHIC